MGNFKHKISFQNTIIIIIAKTVSFAELDYYYALFIADLSFN